MQPQTLIFLGPQGSGKGTQVQLIQSHLSQKDSNRPVVLFEAGKSLRLFAEGSSYTQKLISASLLRGELQPAFVSTYLMSQTFIDLLQGNEHLLVDGFPRSHDQLPAFISAVKFYERENPTVLDIVIPEEESLQRLLKRGRSDDTEESIRERLRWSRESVAPVIEWFKENKEYRFIEIQGNRSIEDVHNDILHRLELTA